MGSSLAQCLETRAVIGCRNRSKMRWLWRLGGEERGVRRTLSHSETRVQVWINSWAIWHHGATMCLTVVNVPARGLQ